MQRSPCQNLTCFSDLSTQKNRNTRWMLCLSSFSFLQAAFVCPKMCDFTTHSSHTHLSAVWLEASETPSSWTSQGAWRCWELGDVSSGTWHRLVSHTYLLDQWMMNAWMDFPWDGVQMKNKKNIKTGWRGPILRRQIIFRPQTATHQGVHGLESSAEDTLTVPTCSPSVFF